MRYSIVILAAIAAVEASPMPLPQAVTAMISPSAAAPSGCMPSMSGSFGIAVVNVTGGAMAGTQLPDGQPQATQISDGQPQAPPTGKPVSQISDGQPQNPTMTMAPVSQISDGQIQATKKMTMAAVSQISDGQVQATYAPVGQISDGQVQATKTAAPVSQISDGQPQGSKAPAVSQKSDGQPQATGAKQAPDGQPQASSGSGVAMVACKTDSTLTVMLDGGVLKDSKGRTGYIASNYQFQFDAPPQAGAIYTSGWTVCGNGSVALGGSAIFYQCLSGNFYNLYDRNWAAQCNPVTINALQLISC